MTNLEIVEDMVKVHEMGEEAYQTFKREYVSENSKPDGFFKSPKIKKLKTFSHFKKKQSVKFNNSEFVT